jgi:hypothetical protein
VTPGQLQHVRDGLPGEYAPLFEATRQGEMDLRR